ncbi:MAG: flagellin [Oscillospiraceae bacterium]|jgi:flagellin|nr:flagellin [Oscillospiraceae bacterium]
MRIQHNIMAMSAYRNYTNNVSAMKKNLEKLSSGYKINRAGDDAAGLAISEKMRAQITGLETAQKNAKDGISLVQTAEGALTEVHDMLNRMVELATMSANGTYDNETDRFQLQKEMDQLRDEIDRIADSANFNGIKLLNGDMDGAGTEVVNDVTVTAVADGDQSGAAGAAGVYSFDVKDFEISGAGTAATATLSINIGGATVTATVALTDGKASAASVAAAIATAVSGGTSVTIANASYTVSIDGTKITLTQQKAPTSTNQLMTSANMKVTITSSVGNGNNSWDQGLHVDTPAAIEAMNKVAQGKFTLTADMVKDGNKLTIGGTEYTFKVGKDGKATGDNVIDLSKYEEGDADLLKKAGEELSKLVNSNKSSKFDVTTQGDGVITLTERKGQVDYGTEWDLKGGAGTAPDGSWNANVKGDAHSGVVTFTSTQAGDPTKGLTLQIGDTADHWNKLKVNIQDMHCDSLDIDSISIADQDSAAVAIDKIKAAINTVSDVRGTLGATQNRLDHTINNLSVMTENIQDAESTIRDVDVAEEMMAYTKNNILIQSAQAMLAQANQVPQGVLQLLQ